MYIQEGDNASSKPLPRAGVVNNQGPVSLRISEVESIRKELEEFLERLRYDPEDKGSTKNSVYLGENQSRVHSSCRSVHRLVHCRGPDWQRTIFTSLPSSGQTHQAILGRQEGVESLLPAQELYSEHPARDQDDGTPLP